MERRWGQRVSVVQVVQIRSGHRTSRGRLRDVSLSGAFVETAEKLPHLRRVHLRLQHATAPVGDDIEAYAARLCDEGVGLEWCDFAPDAIIALLEQQPSRRDRVG